jgi:preprotein translocase subunit SecE
VEISEMPNLFVIVIAFVLAVSLGLLDFLIQTA